MNTHYRPLFSSSIFDMYLVIKCVKCIFKYIVLIGNYYKKEEGRVEESSNY